MDERPTGRRLVDPERRKFLVGAGLVVAAAATPFALGGLLGCKTTETPAPAPSPSPVAKLPTPLAAPVSMTATLPWKYVKLDGVAVAERGYTAYSNGGCMFGAFEGIIGELRQNVGAPYDSFPAGMMKYGKAGVAGWGTICGALNGAAAAIYLVADPKVVDGLIDELYAWYGVTSLPNYKPKTPKFDIKPSVAKSQLCHPSVTNWCDTTGFKALSPERAERCAWLTASVSHHTAALLNDAMDSKAAVLPPLPAEVTGCLACHGKGGTIENVHASRATTCTTCHDVHPIPPRK